MSDSAVVRSTLIGCLALAIWSTLAALTVAAGQTPPFLLVAISFAIAALIALTKWIVRGESIIGHLRQPLAAWALGISGLFGYHFLIFLALQKAPPVEANLLNYLWPLLIVVFSGFLPGHRLRAHHLLGAFTGLLGAALLVTRGDVAFVLDPAYMLGYGAAIAAALVWSSYSVLSRLFARVPTDAVGGFCGAGAILAFICHLMFEPSIWPQGWEWLAVLLLGLGPAGGAFFVWDIGVKKGDIQVLGAISYMTPLLSTLLLIALGMGLFTWPVGVACGLIIGGALIASKDMVVGRRKSTA